MRGVEIVNGDVQVPQVVNEMTDCERCREPTVGQHDKPILELVVVDQLQESADLANAPGRVALQRLGVRLAARPPI
jgi:hypothetical protein